MFSSQDLLSVLALIQCRFHPRVTAVARKSSQLFYQRCKWQVTPKHVYNLDLTMSEWADYAVQALCGNISGKRAHTQLVRERSSSRLDSLSHCGLISAARASSPKEWNWFARADLHLRRRRSTDTEKFVEPSAKIFAREEKATSTTTIRKASL